LEALLQLPYTAGVLWRTIGQVDIVHSSVIGWPYPLGWIANPFAVLRGKRLVIVVESPWRVGGMGRRGWKRRLLDMDPLREWLARWSCKRADLALFTHSRYRDALHTNKHGNAYVAPAVWVNEADILDERAAEDGWATKAGQPVRILFAGRLAAAKGIDVLLTALRSLDVRGVETSVDIIGDGELRDTCVQAAADFRAVDVSVLAPVPYGPDFFALLRRYHALVIPSLSDEQPRIVFDANAQAVPVIASDTDGLRPYVVHGATGWLVRSGDPEALASTLIRAGGAPSELRSMGLAALRATRALTHRAMHRSRSQAIFKHCS
jgi:glycosyltransferase involved in cell wall biosynthesis